MIWGDIIMYQDERKLDFKPIGMAIKKAREAKGWTQEYLAQLVDLTPRSIMYIENRGQHPRLAVAFSIYNKEIIKIQVDGLTVHCLGLCCSVATIYRKNQIYHLSIFYFYFICMTNIDAISSLIEIKLILYRLIYNGTRLCWNGFCSIFCLWFLVCVFNNILPCIVYGFIVGAYFTAEFILVPFLLWGSMVDFVTVDRDKNMTVTFKDGTDIIA